MPSSDGGKSVRSLRSVRSVARSEYGDNDHLRSFVRRNSKAVSEAASSVMSSMISSSLTASTVSQSAFDSDDITSASGTETGTLVSAASESSVPEDEDVSEDGSAGDDVSSLSTLTTNSVSARTETPKSGMSGAQVLQQPSMVTPAAPDGPVGMDFTDKTDAHSEVPSHHRKMSMLEQMKEQNNLEEEALHKEIQKLCFQEVEGNKMVTTLKRTKQVFIEFEAYGLELVKSTSAATKELKGLLAMIEDVDGRMVKVMSELMALKDALVNGDPDDPLTQALRAGEAIGQVAAAKERVVNKKMALAIEAKRRMHLEQEVSRLKAKVERARHIATEITFSRQSIDGISLLDALKRQQLDPLLDMTEQGVKEAATEAAKEALSARSGRSGPAGSVSSGSMLAESIFSE